MKKLLVILLLITSIFVAGCSNKNDEAKFTVIASNFPGYDFARAVVKDVDGAEVKMLLSPGGEMHDFEPTPQDIINIKKSDVFIYVGGESDEWIEDVIDDIDLNKTKVIRLMDLVTVYEEEEVPGMEEEEEEHHHHEEHDDEDHEEIEYDEHVWTSPINAIKIVNSLKDEFVKMDKDNADAYTKNAKTYTDELQKIDTEIRSIVANGKRNLLVFGDRFPLRYFTEEYGLTYSAAFKGCSEQSEASAKTITFLIDKVKENNIPVVLHIELSNKKIAETISKETGAEVLEFNSAHNISQKDFDSGLTYVNIMKKNIEVLKQALN